MFPPSTTSYPLTLSFPPPPRTTTTTSQPRPFRLSSRPTSIIKSQTSRSARRRQTRLTHPTPWRLYILPTLSILSFAILILAIIYVNCVGIPTSSKTNSSTSANPNTSTSSNPSTRSSSTENQTTSDSNWSSGISTTLFAYTALTPLLTFLLVSTELVVYLNFPRKFTSNLAFTLSLITSILLLAAWTTNTSIWLHCELPLSGANSHVLGGSGGGGICPDVIRGHFMYGVREISIAKNVLGWVVVMGLLGQVGGLVAGWREVRDARRASGRGVWGGNEEEELGEVVVIGLESIKEVEDEAQVDSWRGKGMGKGARVEVTAIV